MGMIPIPCWSACADELGLVVLVGRFYRNSVQRMRHEASLWRVADEMLMS